MKTLQEYTILNAVTPVAITSSTDATPIVVTATAHGLSTDDQVLIYGHTTNIATNGLRKVIRLTADTFSLKDSDSGSSIAGTGAGAGAGGLLLAAPKVLDVTDATTCVLSIYTSGTATLTLKIAGSIGDIDRTPPNFGGTVSSSNQYSFVEIINLDTGADVNGATGVAAAVADLAAMYEVNVNQLKYLTIFPTAWTQGAITVKAALTSTNQ